MPRQPAQGAADELVLPAVQTGFVNGLCGDGQVIDYRTYAGLYHVGIITSPGSACPPT